VSGPVLTSVVASLKSGALLPDGEALEARQQLADLAATLPEIYGTVDVGCLQRVAERLGTAASGVILGELVLLSETRVHVIEPLGRKPGYALLAVGPSSRSVGLVLSQVHARVHELEQEP